MSSDHRVTGSVTVRDGPTPGKLTVELWEAIGDVPNIAVPYDWLPTLPIVRRQRGENTPVATAKTDTDGKFAVDVPDELGEERYRVRVFDGTTFLGSQEATLQTEGADGGGLLEVVVSGKGAAGVGLAGLAGLAVWYAGFRGGGDETAAPVDDQSGDDTEGNGDDAGGDRPGDDDLGGGGPGSDPGNGEDGDDDGTGDADDSDPGNGGSGDDDTGNGGDEDQDDGDEDGDGDENGDGDDEDNGDEEDGDEDDGDEEGFNVRESLTDSPSVDGRPSLAPDVNEQAQTLFRGEAPRQEGAELAAMRESVLSVYDGTVVDRDGESIPDVTVRVKGHSEFGMTKTDEDGSYALAVNGGRYYAFVYEKEGYLPIQRRRRVGVRDYDSPGEVVLVGDDERVSTPVTMGADEYQVVHGPNSDDADGQRSSLLLVPPGTTSWNHGQQVDFHAVEYTVGDRGEAAMPAILPARTGYTFAMEYVATATDVDRPFMQTNTTNFSQPVIHYNENFVGFPVGTVAPTGVFERGQARWDPTENGVVLEILDIDGGLATIDIDGDGTPSGDDELETMGITEGEREQLATAYDPGTKLWRSPVPHFTPIDINWPIVPPEGSDNPPRPDQDPRRPGDC